MNYLISGEPPERWGNAHPNIVPYQTFAGADGHIILAVGNDGQFRQVLRRRPRDRSSRDDPRFATNAARVRNRDVLVPLLAEMVAKRTRATGSRRWKRRACRAGRSIDLTKCSPTRRCRRAACGVDLPHPRAGRCRWCAAR